MIEFTTINADGEQVTRVFHTVEEMRQDWYSEEGTTLPANDDKVVFAKSDGEEIQASVFEDVIEALRVMKLPYTKKFRSFGEACAYVHKHITENGWIFEQKCICTGAGCHVDRTNCVTLVGYEW